MVSKYVSILYKVRNNLTVFLWNLFSIQLFTLLYQCVEELLTLPGVATP